MSMKSTLSGYPEWLPGDRMVEQRIVRRIREVFELHGFAPVETRSVEPLEVILSKGETDKEIYTLRRLQAAEDERDKGIGLHFDLTVPFARYVVENRNDLVFPFRRYQIQKAWRGERPGLGRYREFLQADIDIVDSRPLGIHSDIEILRIMGALLGELPVPATRMRVNNRKLLEGFYRALGIERVTEVLRIVDKLEKIGRDKVSAYLVEDLSMEDGVARKCLDLGSVKTNDAGELRKAVAALGCAHPLIEEGLEELCLVVEHAGAPEGGTMVADLSIARGFDYYTGTVCEVEFADFPDYPAIAAGGRYDSLVSEGKTRLPGMGMSLGITRILGLVLHEGLLQASRAAPSAVLVALVSAETRDRSDGIAHRLRARGIPCEVFPNALKYGRQIAYADKKGIPFVWFPDEEGKGDGEVRDMRSKTQSPADPDAWMPSREMLAVQLLQDADAAAALLRDRKYMKR